MLKVHWRDLIEAALGAPFNQSFSITDNPRQTVVMMSPKTRFENSCGGSC